MLLCNPMLLFLLSGRSHLGLMEISQQQTKWCCKCERLHLLARLAVLEDLYLEAILKMTNLRASSKLSRHDEQKL